MIPHSKTYLDSDVKRSVAKTLESGWIISGALNRQLKQKLRELTNREYVLLYSSGAEAFCSVLEALNLAIGSEVLIPNYICDSVYRVIDQEKLSVKVYDNQANKWTSSYAKIKESSDAKTSAVLLNHTFGIRLRDYEKFSCPSGVSVIEDCCHAFVSSIGGKPIGVNSIASFYSFNATKFLAGGEGGAIATDSIDLYDELKRRQRDLGMSDLSCSLALSQIEKLDFFVERRAVIAERYRQALSIEEEMQCPVASVYFRYPILSDCAESFFSSKIVHLGRALIH